MNAPRFVRLALLLTLISASGAYADGTYQRTDDRKKTLVWNNDPKPEDAATWSGQRDAEGYATGRGTLKWFRQDRSFITGSNIFAPRKTLLSAYSGTMVHGKFKGGVTTVDRGKTYHATFADGHKTGRWIAGPVIEKAESAEAAEVVKKAERAEPETSTEVAGEPRTTERASEEKTQDRVAETEDVPAAGPSTAEEKPEAGESEVTKEERPAAKVSKPPVAQASTEEPDQSAAPRTSASRKAALQPGAVRAIERPTRAAAKKTETETIARAERVKSEATDKPAKVAKPASSQPPKADMPPSEDIPAEGPVAAEAPKAKSPVSKSAKAGPAPVTKETPVDNSIRTLTGPPASLHVGAPPPEVNPPTQIPTPPAAAASSPPSAPKLTAVQAMDISDIEARTRGYDLGEYQLPKAEYNAASDTWSVGYVAREADTKDKKLSVTVQDKTGKAEVKK